MSHEWIFDVLTDLRAYAKKNDLPRTAEMAAEMIHVARSEIPVVRQIGGKGVPDPSDERPN
ncbi:MAG: hypothetical protein V4804_07745 [Pseudomonadota bacterium]|jgi:hypothetical protein